jgi:hypothetical protein
MANIPTLGEWMRENSDMRYLSQRVTGLKPSGIRKFFDIAATMKDVISLGVGEPDFTTPKPILEAGVLHCGPERPITHPTLANWSCDRQLQTI